ncbi:asparaginase [Mesobacterium pallidum]|uniref:asparaginase n=1 Tax=Mesobacterium pallidum TaxID=2872037 RepID=UPI001EE17859|nr:asparaginase [Mesobacterium pallidum]
MVAPVPMAEIWRGDFLESLHLGHAVICDDRGRVVESWGDPAAVILPRSSVKMIQALPLVASGAAAARGLTSEQLALACASHNGAEIHTTRVDAWLAQLGLSEDDLRCGPQMPDDRPARTAIIKTDASPCQLHNNCSGKHAGFLTLAQHLGAGPEYVDPDHPVQLAARDAFEEVTGAPSPGFGIDGCSAPNFACTMEGLGRAMGWFAGAATRGGTLDKAGAALTDAMRAHPDLVAGETRACTELMRATGGRAAIKTGAEGVYTAILPDQKLGIALKIADGTTRASECAIAALLVRLGALDPEHPATRRRMNVELFSRRGIPCGAIRPAAGLLA